MTNSIENSEEYSIDTSAPDSTVDEMLKLIIKEQTRVFGKSEAKAKE